MVHPVSFTGGRYDKQTLGGCMSTDARYEWRDQQAVLTERMKGFMQNPGNDQLEAVVAEMRAYADAARSGSIEIPVRWVSFN
jgi:hypothetical protein